jgi:UDP-N-acetylglucosamine--N-acetylmuramyl-(pentapeptide) pyrophosphoryl-undecaprenol N-acetylglucosamine transferase
VSERISYFFAGGGTGGHIFPGMAVAEELVAQGPDAGEANISFIVSNRPGDARIMAATSYASIVTDAAPFGVRPRALLRFLRGWGRCVKQVRGLLRERRARGDKVILISMGGFVAAPAAAAAHKEGVPVLLINLDAVPGKANLLMARRARRILTTTPVDRPGWEQIRPIVRSAARAPGDARVCRQLLGLDPNSPTLLVTGASLGAKSINEFMGAFVATHGDYLRAQGWQVMHQTGGGDADVRVVEKMYTDARLKSVVVAFSPDMGRMWGAADAAVSRAGAGSVAECWANRVPTLFMPYPFHADEHQRRNVSALVQRGAAVVVKDHIEPQLNIRDAGTALFEILNSAVARARMKQELASLGDTDGAAAVASAARAMAV